jgi:hypothetical protein
MEAAMRWLVVSILLVATCAQAAAAPRPVVHHDLTVRMDPATARLEVDGRIRFEGGGEGALNFMLHDQLEVASVRLGGEDLSVETLRRWRPRDFYEKPDYSQLGVFKRARQHKVQPPESGWPAEEFELEIQYAGAVYDSLRPPEVAYGRGFETTSGLIDERGAFLSYETFWVPWTRDGRFHFRMRTELPDGWQSMSQGRRAEHFTEDGINVTVWETEAPQELIYLVAGPYVVREREHEGVSIFTYTYENTPEDLCNTYLDATGRYLDQYGDLIAPYGFSKWAMVENWWQTGYGMPGFTLLGDRVIRLPFIVDTSYGHEILHCWWGNGVYVNYASGNWCEGLTAYQADYAYKLDESEDAARDYRRNALTGYLDFASGAEDFPLSEFRERSDFGTQAIGYGKSLMVFHMLEEKVGTVAFEKALSEFYKRHEFEPASWDDIAAMFGVVTGQDLTPWFDHWIDRTGAARISIASLEEGGDGWVLGLQQDGDPFPVQVPVKYHDANGEHEIVVAMDEARASVDLPGSLKSVAVDPDYHVFREVFREEVPATLSQVLGADSTLVVIGDQVDPAMREVLHEVAESWAENQDMVIVDEEDADDPLASGRSLFLLGPGALVDRVFQEAVGALGDAPAKLLADNPGKSLVAVFRDPANAELARAVVMPASPELAPAIGRKIPHYSRYSWLAFDGEQNVGKGNWTVLTSPLRRTLEESE